MEPIFFRPAFKNYVWGGNKLKSKLNKKSEFENIAESWEISTNKNGQSVIVKNRDFDGMPLGDLYNNMRYRKEIFGEKSVYLNEFPILIKFIDANQNLSIQVHPDDEFARKYENSQGKYELWYIMDCKDDAKIICGVKNKSKNIDEIFCDDDIEKNMNYINVKKGDYIYLKPGTVHAILEGIMVCEIQQNSDITYRIYDWNRVGKDGALRKLNKVKAIEVLDIESNNEVRHCNDDEFQQIICNDKFSTDLINVKDAFLDSTNFSTFFAYNVVEGNGFLEYKNNVYELNLGDSFLIPACLGEYQIKGNVKLLKTFI